jgi:hypothetical protein
MEFFLIALFFSGIVGVVLVSQLMRKDPLLESRSSNSQLALVGFICGCVMGYFLPANTLVKTLISIIVCGILISLVFAWTVPRQYQSIMRQNRKR